MQGVPELIAALGRNPLPDAFVVTPREEGIEPLAARPRQAAGRRARAGRRALGAAPRAPWRSIGARRRSGCWPRCSAPALVAVTFNTIRLQILTQREEIEVSKLIGATDAFIRRPFYYAGPAPGRWPGGVVALRIVVGAALALLNREVRVAGRVVRLGLPVRFPGGWAMPWRSWSSPACWAGWAPTSRSRRQLREIEPPRC